MKKELVIPMVLALWLILPVILMGGNAPVDFDTYFTDRTMRIDYFHMADKETETVSIDKIYQQGIWAGNPDSLIDTFTNGQYYIKVYDKASGTLIYSKGFNSYCGEYRTTSVAAKGIKRTYHETALIPFPKNPIRFTLEFRDRKNRFVPLFSQDIEAKGRHIIKEKLVAGVTVGHVLKSGDPHRKVDLAILAEGYTAAEKGAFQEDAKRVLKELFSIPPYDKYRNSFNIYSLFKASQESGMDEPRNDVFKNTAIGASFNALDLRRYMLTEDNRALRDIAAHVPYDTIIILVNTKRYGGGGIYNFYCIFSIKNSIVNYLLLHEFGHSFAGLADEYYSGSVTYNDFYPRGYEPGEPNITALLDPSNLKWKHLATKGTPIPTPWGKEEYDKMKRSERIDFFEKNKAKYKDIVGAFEGAGYSSTGLYRPSLDCTMFSLHIGFCKVCEHGITRMIKYYTRTK